jgi:hypothetical protein
MYHFDVIYEEKNALCGEHNAAVPPSAPTLKSALKPLVASHAIRHNRIEQKAVEQATVACRSINDSHA